MIRISVFTFYQSRSGHCFLYYRPLINVVFVVSWVDTGTIVVVFSRRLLEHSKHNINCVNKACCTSGSTNGNVTIVFETALSFCTLIQTLIQHPPF